MPFKNLGMGWGLGWVMGFSRGYKGVEDGRKSPKSVKIVVSWLCAL